jgi:hypothetical protein
MYATALTIPLPSMATRPGLSYSPERMSYLNLNHHHHVGILVYVLERNLATGTPWQKWWARARVGNYLGKSPRHARSVGLVLNPYMGMVSPQFHLKYDDTFETIRGLREVSHGIWRQKCYFSDYTRPITSPRLPQNNEVKANKEKKEVVRETAEERPAIVEVTDGLNEIFAADPVPTNNEVNAVPDDPIAQNEGGNPAVQPTGVQSTRRSTRAWRPTQRMIESLQQEDLNLSAALYHDDYQTFIDR